MNAISQPASFNYSQLLNEVALNPQPLPPGPDPDNSISQLNGSEVSLNPQPLPPGPDPDNSISQLNGSEVSLNPQPLPPGPDPDVQVSSYAKVADELNPQPLPPGPSENHLADAWNDTAVLHSSHLSAPNWLISSLGGNAGQI